MSKKIMKNIPKLRFSEFVNEPEWKKVKLSKLGKLVSGLTYSPDDVRENGLLVLRSSNVQDGEISLEDNVYVKTDIKGANLSEPNDILICVRNGSKALIGKNALIPDNMPLCTHGAFMTTFRAESPKFVFQLFQTKDYQKQVNADLGATINSINGNKFIKYEFNVPSTEKEQTKIADCLSSIDSIISTQNQRIELLKEHKNGLLQKIFPKDGEDIPKIRFTEFLNSQEWKQKQLGSLTKVIVGGTPSTTESVYWNEGIINWLSSGDINNGIIKQASKLITPLGLEKSSAKLMPPDTVVLAMTGATLGRIGYLAIETSGNQSVAGLIPNREYNSKFLFYLLQKNTNTILSMAGGAAQAGINKATIESLEFYFPLINEQKKIADCLTSIDEEINLQIQKVELLKKHKKALLQQLFPSNEVING